MVRKNLAIMAFLLNLVNLRFDDTNPEKESIEFINAIKEDINWLGFNWDSQLQLLRLYPQH